MLKIKEKIIFPRAKKYLIIIFIFLGIFLFYIYRSQRVPIIEVDLPSARPYQEFINGETNDNQINGDIISENNVKNTGESLANEIEIGDVKTDKSFAYPDINLAIPFTSQAPSGNWDQPFQDACEEASILMLDYYYRAENLPGQAEVEDILRAMVLWQEENWGGHYNLPVYKSAELAEAYFGYRTEVINDLSAEVIKQYLNQGTPVIVPADGHKLANPFFRGDGPDYHMLIIKGFANGKFISNDPGTRRGADFIYTQENLLSSIFDWNEKTDQADGPKRAFVIYKN